jgi:hypothetical protein
VRKSHFRDANNELVNPIGIVKVILKERESVALEWQAISRDSPNEYFWRNMTVSYEFISGFFVSGSWDLSSSDE